MRNLSRWARSAAALAGAVALLTLLAVPGTASAATSPGIGTVPTGTITPTLQCLTKGSNGSVTAVLGYTSAAKTTATIAVGQLNQLSPSRLSGKQPSTFQPGAHPGVLSLTMTSSEYMNGAYWWVDGNVVYFDWARTQNGPFCSPGTTLPANGNGTGIAVGLVAAGLAGVLVVRRVRRTAGRPPTALLAG